MSRTDLPYERGGSFGIVDAANVNMLMFSSFNVNHVYFFSLVHHHATMLIVSKHKVQLRLLGI